MLVGHLISVVPELVESLLPDFLITDIYAPVELGKIDVDPIWILRLILPMDTFDDVRGDSDSLAGLILELGGYIPQVNDVIPCGDFEFTVLEANRNRINKVKVAIKPVVQ